jgi:hypothetical protein
VARRAGGETGLPRGQSARRLFRDARFLAILSPVLQ